MEEECVYKILLLGDACTDKSLFLLRYTDETFQDIHMATIGFDYRLKTMKLKKGKNIKLQIWDTAGQERFRAITKNYYKGSHGIILLYDVTNLQSFENIKSWINQIREEASPNVVIYLVGSKIDLEEERKVTKKDGEKFIDLQNPKIKLYDRRISNKEKCAFIFFLESFNIMFTRNYFFTKIIRKFI